MPGLCHQDSGLSYLFYLSICLDVFNRCIFYFRDVTLKCVCLPADCYMESDLRMAYMLLSCCCDKYLQKQPKEGQRSVHWQQFESILVGNEWCQGHETFGYTAPAVRRERWTLVLTPLLCLIQLRTLTYGVMLHTLRAVFLPQLTLSANTLTDTPTGGFPGWLLIFGDAPLPPELSPHSSRWS